MKQRIIFYSGVVILILSVLIVTHIKVSSIEASVYKMPVMQFAPDQLVNDVDCRLKDLQRNVTGAAFYVHKIKMRENLWKLSSRRGYSVHSIIGCNPQLKTYDMSIGQRIILPSRGGVLHQIQKGDTWEKVAVRYKVDKDIIVKANSNVGELLQGNMVFVPGGKPDMDLMNDDMRKKYELRALFVSPLGGRLSSTFGKRKHPVTGKRSLHGGIDIAVREGTFVGAAAAGTVILASSDVGHYGKAVFIEHQNGYVTHYGHLSKILVRQGQRVKERQVIAKSGSTGRSTGPHLHFTVKRNDTAIDPLKFLW